MKTKTKARFMHSFDRWLRDGVWGIGEARLDSPDHCNRPHIEAHIGGGLYVRATAVGDARRCSMYLAVYCMSDFVTLIGSSKGGIPTIPSEMDAAAEALLDDIGIERVLGVVGLEVKLRRMRLAALRKSLAAANGATR